MHRILLLAILALAISSCGFHNGLTSNRNLHETQVVLGQRNFKIVDAVQGQATVTYILGFGGAGRKALLAEARREMLRSADLVGSARAVINETVEVHWAGFPFVRTYTVTVSGHVVEFE